jgi:hypothetical protein
MVTFSQHRFSIKRPEDWLLVGKFYSTKPAVFKQRAAAEPFFATVHETGEIWSEFATIRALPTPTADLDLAPCDADQGAAVVNLLTRRLSLGGKEVLLQSKFPRPLDNPLSVLPFVLADPDIGPHVTRATFSPSKAMLILVLDERHPCEISKDCVQDSCLPSFDLDDGFCDMSGWATVFPEWQPAFKKWRAAYLADPAVNWDAPVVLS